MKYIDTEDILMVAFLLFFFWKSSHSLLTYHITNHTSLAHSSSLLLIPNLPDHCADTTDTTFLLLCSNILVKVDFCKAKYGLIFIIYFNTNKLRATAQRFSVDNEYSLKQFY